MYRRGGSEAPVDAPFAVPVGIDLGLCLTNDLSEFSVDRFLDFGDGFQAGFIADQFC